ncbi:hypothetical protein BKA62DRAFT_764259 [Auriculariales sp. MPI-PUGE-AT-0066]|nr:hypothetical protein BKA62DRAFT_764259 [Auriculariales sp. MPI-PUGE-AT-0066]
MAHRGDFYQQPPSPGGAGYSSTALAGAGAPVSGFDDPRASGAMGTTTPTTVPPPQKTPFWKTRKFIICQIISFLLFIVILFVLLFPVVKAIAQLVVNRSTLQIDSAQIISPQNGSFILHMSGMVFHTGIFNAVIKFKNKMDVSWVDSDDPESDILRPLGYIEQLQDLNARHKAAKLEQQSNFIITDENAFGEFTAAMITRPSFTWLLQSDNLDVRALKFPTSHGVKFKKRTTLRGINSFDGNVRLVEFKLPRDDPEGGITFIATTEMNNSSPFDVALGTTIFDLTYQGMALGRGTSTNTQLVPGLNNITLEGRLIPHTDENELVLTGDLFTKYLNGEAAPVQAKGVSTKQADGTDISWLSKGIQALTLNVPFQAPNAINPIRSIDIGYLNLNFSEQTAWNPDTSSNQVTAQLALPFGFSTNISEISNAFAIVQNGKEVAKLQTPPAASTSDIKVLGETDTQGVINITLKDSPLQVPDDAHADFSKFNADLTNSDKATFQLVGSSRAVANLPIGKIILDPIKFNVTSSLNGLQGLKNFVVVKTIDVVGGTADHMNLALSLGIYNPSNLNLATGDLTLQLQKDGSVIGTSLLSGLNLVRGNNSLDGSAAFTPNANDQGKQVLNDFVAGKSTVVTIAGYSGSTQIQSLLEAFEGLNLETQLPGLDASLLSSASLEVLDTTGHGNNIAHVTVDLNNPFTADLEVTAIRATVKSHGITVGTIDTKTQFQAKGKKTTTSPTQDIDLNLDPPSLFTVTRDLALDAGLNTQQLDGIVALGGYEYVHAAPPGRRHLYRGKRNIYTGFSLPEFVDAAFAKLKSDVTLSTDVLVGDYATTIEFTQNGLPTATDKSLHLLLPILAQPIVQKVVSGSELGISTVLIRDPSATTFKNQLKGSITNAGPFDANITFSDGLTISWSGKPLGKLAMPPVQVVGDVGASLDLTADFVIADVGHLADFTKTLLNEESFEWEIAGENLTVAALGISVSGISLPAKKVVLKGMNGLKGGVVINSFDLPSNDPAGGIHLTLDTTITNPAQVGVELDSITFQNYFGSTHLGPATSSGGSFTLLPQATFQQALVGRLIPQTEQAALDDVSTVFSAFIHGKDSNVVVRGDTTTPSVEWLSAGLQSLSIETVLPARGVLDVITNIELHELTLDFTPETAFAPLSSSKDTTAAFQLPFGFPLDIVSVQQDIHVGYGGSDSMAVLSIPKSPAQTDVEARVINLQFADVPFAVQGGQQGNFEQFLASTTMSETQTFQLSGEANTDAETAVGLLHISGIAFKVSTTIAGLQGLNAAPAVVSDLDVNHGYSDYLLIKVSTDLLNPSNITISSGDVAFDLQFSDHVVGTANIAGLVLTPGHANYSTDVHYSPKGDAVPAGQLMLENYIQGVTSSTTILGTTAATNVESLKQAFSQIRLGADIPALHQNLITTASLVFPDDILTTKIAQSTFDLSNPFTASINLLVVGANATYKGIYLGAIENVDRHSDPITALGHTKITSPALPLHFNLNPVDIIKLLLLRSQDSGTDLGPLPDLFQTVLNNPNVDLPIVATVNNEPSGCSSGHQFDVNGAILRALKNMPVHLDVTSTVALDEYVTDLRFAQDNVTAVTDETALKLIGAVAPPIVQNLVNAASLSFSSANITNIANDGFDLDLVGSLTGTGPLDALITFVEPVTVKWQGRNIAQISLPPVCAAADSGAPNYKTSGKLKITDQAAFTDYATFLLHNEAFEWEISTDKLRVTSLGSNFDNVSLTKTVSLKAFNGLPGVTISNFELPSDDSAGGITVSTDSMIPSPAQLGIDLGTVTFKSYFSGTFVGPLSSPDLALAPEAVTKTHLTGRIVPQSGNDLNNIGELFSKYLAGENQTLSVVGDSVDPCGCGQEVGWLSAAFKTLTIDVVLPGHVYKIIDSIEISDLGIVMVQPEQAFAPLATSQHTLAQYRNPFGFSLQAIQSAQTLVISSQGVDAAELKIPMGPVDAGVSTGNLAPLIISFHEIPLRSLNNAAFAGFFALVTNTATVQAELSGSADVIARTAIGDVPIAGIPFDVTSPIKGIASFDHKFGAEDLSVSGSGGAGGTEWLTSKLTVKLTNPSNISLDTINLALPVYYKDVYLGRTFVEDFSLVPGENTMPAEFRYKPENANDTVAQSFVSEYLESSGVIPVNIKGDGQSSPFASLGPALSAVTLSGSVQGIGALLIKHIHVVITIPDTLITNEVIVDFDVENPLDTDMRVTNLQSDSGLHGITYAQFSTVFDNYLIPSHQTVNSGPVEHVILPQGAIPTLDIIPEERLDVAFASTAIVGEGGNGYTLPWLQYQQDNIPTTYDLVVAGARLAGTSNPKSIPDIIREWMKSQSASSSSTLSTTSVQSDTSDSAAPTSSDVSSAAPTPSEVSSAASTPAASSATPDTTTTISHEAPSATSPANVPAATTDAPAPGPDQAASDAAPATDDVAPAPSDT